MFCFCCSLTTAWVFHVNGVYAPISPSLPHLICGALSHLAGETVMVGGTGAVWGHLNSMHIVVVQHKH